MASEITQVQYAYLARIWAINADARSSELRVAAQTAIRHLVVSLGKKCSSTTAPKLVLNRMIGDEDQGLTIHKLEHAMLTRYVIFLETLFKTPSTLEPAEFAQLVDQYYLSKCLILTLKSDVEGSSDVLIQLSNMVNSFQEKIFSHYELIVREAFSIVELKLKELSALTQNQTLEDILILRKALRKAMNNQKSPNTFSDVDCALVKAFRLTLDNDAPRLSGGVLLQFVDQKKRLMPSLQKLFEAWVAYLSMNYREVLPRMN